VLSAPPDESVAPASIARRDAMSEGTSGCSSPDSEEWVIQLNYPVDGPSAQSDAQVEADARTALGVPDMPWKIHKITRWSVEAVMASAFRADRVYLLGDAAHRHPPTGGLGLTSAIQGAQKLCWKLALVVADAAAPALLDTYEAERRPVDERNAQRSLENAVNHFGIAAKLGISHENTPGQNMEQLRRMWSGRPEDAAHRAGVLRAMRAQSMEFSELNVEYGSSYRSAAVVPDGTVAPAPGRRRPRVPAVHPARCPAAPRLDRGRGRQPPAGQGPGCPGAISADRRRGRPGLVRRSPAPRGRGERPYRHGADRAPRR